MAKHALVSAIFSKITSIKNAEKYKDNSKKIMDDMKKTQEQCERDVRSTSNKLTNLMANTSRADYEGGDSTKMTQISSANNCYSVAISKHLLATYAYEEADNNYKKAEEQYTLVSPAAAAAATTAATAAAAAAAVEKKCKDSTYETIVKTITNCILECIKDEDKLLYNYIFSFVKDKLLIDDVIDAVKKYEKYDYNSINCITDAYQVVNSDKNDQELFHLLEEGDIVIKKYITKICKNLSITNTKQIFDNIVAAIRKSSNTIANQIQIEGTSIIQMSEENNIEDIILKDFKNKLLPSVFSRYRELFGMIDMDQKTKLLINKLQSVKPGQKISDNLISWFPSYLHKRVSDPLSKSEQELLNPHVRINFSDCIGKLVVYKERYDEYKWAIYIKMHNLHHLIFVNNDTIQVNGTDIIYFPNSETLLQTGTNSYKLSKDNEIEHYNFN